MRCRVSRLIRIVTVFIAVVLALTLLLGGTTLAITNGQPDGNNHPYVCVVVMFDESWQFVGAGSGVLHRELGRIASETAWDE